MVSAETKGVLRGEYGQLPAEPDPAIIKKVLGNEKRITCRPADLLKPELAKYREEIKDYIQQDEDVLSYALFPQVALNFFKYRQAHQKHVDREVGDTTKGIQPV